MYNDKLKPILSDLESKEIEIAGGGVVGIVLSTINSLIKYIGNLTVNKKNYEDVQDKINEILDKANDLKNKSLNVIDDDKNILEEILSSYKTRKDDMDKYIEVCKKSVEFCEYVLNIAFETLKLSCEISEVGNRMLASDFKICKYYSYASIKSAVVNVNINLESITDEKYKEKVIKRCNKILKETDKLMKGLD